MVGRCHHQDGIGIEFPGLERRQRDRRRRVAARGFQQNARRLHVERAQLFRHREPMRFVADHDRRPGSRDRGETQGGFLQHGMPAGEREELLGVHLARQRPQPRTRASRQDHRKHCAHVLAFMDDFTAADWHGS